jgi:putative ABC transport system permease protein
MLMPWILRVWNTVRSRRLDEELSEEMADHIERRAAKLIQDGHTRDEAYRQAHMRFGNLASISERSRDLRLWPQVEATSRDLTFAMRGLRKQPAFGVTAIISLALSMASVSAIYSIVDAAILRRLPVYRPSELFTLTYPDISDSGITAENERDSFSYPEFLSFREATGPTAQLSLYSFPGPVEVKGLRKGKITRAFTSGEGFNMLGVAPEAGRLFSAIEDKEPTPVAVISYDLWNREFERDPAVLKRNLRMNGKLYEVIGVASKNFFGVEPGKFVDVWLPASDYDAAALSRSDWHWFRILGRITPGYGILQIQARLQSPFHAIRVDIVKRNPTAPEAIKKQFLQSKIHARQASSGVSSFRQSFARPLWIVFAVAWTILLIACANVAGLLLARSTARAGEMAMRISLGAGRWRLMRQMFTESLLLACFGGAFGWLLARFSAPFLASWLSTGDDPVQLVLAPDTRVLAFCAGISTLATLIFGIVPA